jgi:hypothetical protein
LDETASGNTRELEDLLDRASYEMTSARAAGLGDIDALRSALRRLSKLVGDADALAQSVNAQRREEE